MVAWCMLLWLVGAGIGNEGMRQAGPGRGVHSRPPAHQRLAGHAVLFKVGLARRTGVDAVSEAAELIESVHRKYKPVY